MLPRTLSALRRSENRPMVEAMIALIFPAPNLAVALIKSKSRLEAENAVLRLHPLPGSRRAVVSFDKIARPVTLGRRA